MKRLASIVLILAMITSCLPQTGYASAISIDEQQENVPLEYVIDYSGNVYDMSEFAKEQTVNINDIEIAIGGQGKAELNRAEKPTYYPFWPRWENDPRLAYFSEHQGENYAGWAYEEMYNALVQENIDKIAVSTKTEKISTSLFDDLPSIQLSSSASFTLSLKSDGTVWAWGANEFGQCGPNYIPEEGPAQIPGLTNIKEIAAGWTFGMALDNEGNVWTWGSNLYGELGDGTTQTRIMPQKVQNLPPVKTISAPGMAHAGLAVGEDNTLWGWGVAGQFSSKEPLQFETPVDSFTNTPAQMKKVVYAYGDFLNCFAGIDEDGRVWEWSLSNVTDSQIVPVLSQLGQESGNAKDLVAGHNFIAVLFKQGTVSTKGENKHKELGTGRAGQSLVYSPVVGIDGRPIEEVKSISAGCSNLYIFTENNSYCTGNASFGMNDSGQATRSTLYARYMSMGAMASGGMNFTVIADGQGNEYSIGFNGHNYLGVPSNIKENLSFVEVNSAPVSKVVWVSSPIIITPDLSSVRSILFETMPYYKEDGTIVEIPITWGDIQQGSFADGGKYAVVMGDNPDAFTKPDTPYRIHPVIFFKTTPLQIAEIINPERIEVNAYITKEALRNKLPKYVQIVERDGKEIPIYVQWDVEDFDATAIGTTQTITGRLSLNEGITNPKNLTAAIEVTVIDAVAPSKMITEIPEIEVAVVLGTSASQLLSELPDRITVVLDDGTTPSLPVIWNTTNYDPTQEGEAQTLTGNVALEAGITNPNNLTATALVSTIKPQTRSIKAVNTAQVSVDQNIYLTPVAPTDAPEDYGLIETVDLPETVTVILQNDETAEVPVLWAVSGYDPTQPGKQEFDGELVLSEDLNISNPQNFPAKLKVTVAPKAYQAIFTIPMYEPLEVYPGTTFAEMSEQAQREGKLVYVLSLDLDAGDDSITVCPISFTEEDNLGFTKDIPGEYTLIARLPDNFASLEDLDIVATTPFRVVVMEPQVIVSSETARMNAYQSVSPENLEDIPAQVNVTLENGMVIPVDVEWDWREYKLAKDVAGEHIVSGRLINLPSMAVQPAGQNIIPAMIVNNIPVNYDITGLQSDNLYEADAGLTLDELTEILKPTLTFEITSTTVGINLVTDYTVSVILEDVKNPEFDPQTDGYYPIMGTLALPTNIACPTVTEGDPYEQIDLFTYPVNVKSVEPVYMLAEEGVPFTELEGCPTQVIVTLTSVGPDGKNKKITTGVDWGMGVGYTPFPDGLTDDTPVTMEVTGLLDNYPTYVNGAGVEALLVITMTRVYDLVAISPSRIPAVESMEVKLGSSLDDIYTQIADHSVELTLANRKEERHTATVTFQLREEDNADYDPVTLGEDMLTGYIPLAENIKNPDGLGIEIVVEKKKYTISSSKVVQLTGVESGTPFEEIGLPELVTVVRNDGETEDIPVIWDGSNYNPTRLGSQAVRGAFATPLPIHLENPNKRQANAIVKIIDTSAQILSLEQLPCDTAMFSVSEDIVSEEPIPGYTEYRYLAEILWEDGATSFQVVSIFVETEME